MAPKSIVKILYRSIHNATHFAHCIGNGPQILLAPSGDLFDCRKGWGHAQKGCAPLFVYPDCLPRISAKQKTKMSLAIKMMKKALHRVKVLKTIIWRNGVLMFRYSCKRSKMMKKALYQIKALKTLIWCNGFSMIFTSVRI